MLQGLLNSLGIVPAPVPEAVLAHPSMMSADEKSFLFHLAHQYYSGEGVIVDAGLFLGASTVAFGTGLRKNVKALRAIAARGGRPIHSYDIAIWVDSFNKYLEVPAVQAVLGDERYTQGQDFAPLLRRILREHEDVVDLRIGDIVKTIHADCPVEIAFLDCLKTGERDQAVFRTLGPHYVPGRTIVIQQDYFYHKAIDAKIRQEFLIPYFEYIDSVGSSAIFRLQKPIPADYFVDDPVSRIPIDESVDLLRAAARRASEPRFRVAASLAVVNHLMNNRRRAEADTELRAIEESMQTGRPPRRLEEMVASLRRRLARPVTDADAIAT